MGDSMPGSELVALMIGPPTRLIQMSPGSFSGVRSDRLRQILFGDREADDNRPPPYIVDCIRAGL